MSPTRLTLIGIEQRSDREGLSAAILLRRQGSIDDDFWTFSVEGHAPGIEETFRFGREGEA